MMKAMLAQCKAELLRTLRNKKFLITSVVMPVVLYLIFSSSVGDQVDVGGLEWKTYYLMSMAAFGIIGASINTISIRFASERSQGWVRLLRITPLPSWAYLASKIASQLILNAGTITFIFIVGAVVKGIHLSLLQWLSCGLWLWLGVLPFMALGTLIGTIRSVEVVQVVANLSFMAMSLLGGLWMPIQAMPKVMQSIAQWMPTYRFGQGAWSIVAGGSPSWAGIAVLAAYVIVFVLLSSYRVQRQEAM